MEAWQGWNAGQPSRYRIMATAWTSIRGPADLYLETARAVLYAAAHANLETVVVTQNRRLTVDSLLRTLAVEAVVHHTDLEPALPDAPATSGLLEVRRVLDGLLGEPAPKEWDDIRYIRIATGRLPLNTEEQATLGPLARRLPLFG